MSEPHDTLRLDGFLPYRLSFTSNLLSGAIARTYESLFGLKIPEWRLMAVIGEAGEITQQAICERTRMDKVTVSRAAAALVERGILERIANAADRRSHLLCLTPLGFDLYDRIAPKALEFEQRVFGDFEPQEVDLLIALLRRIDVATLSVAEEQER